MRNQKLSLFKSYKMAKTLSMEVKSRVTVAFKAFFHAYIELNMRPLTIPRAINVQHSILLRYIKQKRMANYFKNSKVCKNSQSVNIIK